MGDTSLDDELMRRAIRNGAAVRAVTTPRPWVGAVVVTADGEVHDGATEPAPGRHAEVVALDAAGDAARGATVFSTLEPCSHVNVTGPCADALVEAGVARVVIGVEDPDHRVRGSGIQRLRDAGIDVTVGVCTDDVTRQLAPYLVHRSTGRSYVVLKVAATLDGRTAAPDGSSQWITGEAARVDAHRLRAESDAIVVGAGTVRADDPTLTVRDVTGRDPVRVVLGRAPEDAKVHPALELSGDLGSVLDELGGRGIIQVLVEGGATVAHGFHAAGLVDRYVVYLAPALLGGDDGRGLFAGPGAATIADAWRGRIVSVQQLGNDIRLDLEKT